MNILLDTHFLIWAIADTKKLHAREQELLADPENGVFVSVVSIWEIAIKSAIGKMEMEPAQVAGLPEAVREARFEIIGLEPSEAASFRLLPKAHKDHFDRMLVWQAISRALHLMTRDKDLAVYRDAGLKFVG